jgi:hypothetical protein
MGPDATYLQQQHSRVIATTYATRFGCNTYACDAPQRGSVPLPWSLLNFSE